MQICRLKIRHFRGIKEADIKIGDFTAFLGENNIGKTTVLEAIDLALGPERLSGYDPITEHDFYGGAYRSQVESLEEGGQPQEDPSICIEVLLDELTETERGAFSGTLVDIDPKTKDLARGRVQEENYGLRIVFLGTYDSDEDEFVAQTFFAQPGEFNPDESRRVTKKQKRRIGFLYLRSFRTARRAASLQRGTLLDILLRLREARPKVWEHVLDRLHELGVSLDDDDKFKDALSDVEGHLLRYLPHYKGSEIQSGLHVGRLTRAHLRNIMVYFLESRDKGHLVPYDRMGTGVSNLLVLALLSAIAEGKKSRESNVIFAMEEPETAVPPYTQRRIVRELKERADQVLMTTHSPYVAEEFLLNNILMLQPGSGGGIEVIDVQEAGEIKLKNLRREFRLKYAEGLFARSVLIVEGVTEELVLPEIDALLESETQLVQSKSEQGEGVGEDEEITDNDHEEYNYLSLTLAGVVIIRAQGDGGIPEVGRFFKSLEVPTFALADARRKDDSDLKKKIEETVDRAYFLPQKSMEEYLSETVGLGDVKTFLREVEKRDDYPQNNPLPRNSDPELDWRRRLKHVLDKRKGEAYAALLVSMLDGPIPDYLRETLKEISSATQESGLKYERDEAD